MLKQKLKLGFIGGGLNSAIGRVHWSATAIDSLFEVTCGIFSRNKDVNRKTAEYYGLTKNRAYNEIDVMLSEEKLDAIVVMNIYPTYLTNQNGLYQELLAYQYQANIHELDKQQFFCPFFCFLK